jgi:hypothetical protein
MNRAKILLLLCLVLILSACRSLENAPADKPTLEVPGESPIELPAEMPVELPTELPTEELAPAEEDLGETGPPGLQVPLPTKLMPIILPTQEGSEVPMPELPSVPSGTLEGLVEQAKQDLAKRLSITLDQIKVVQAREVTWPDSSLGCPKPGMMYMMVLSPGFQIILSVEGRDFNYHAGQSGGVFYCESPSPPASSNSIDN